MVTGNAEFAFFARLEIAALMPSIKKVSASDELP
jgi:hypothetical protein